MSRPETFTLRCDRCGYEMRRGEVFARYTAKGLIGHCPNPDESYRYTSHRQATLDGGAAGWRLTSMEEVCKACVAKESEQHGPGGTSDD